MSYRIAQHESAITKTLAECVSSLKRVAPQQWSFSLSNGHDISGSACIDEEWLMIRAQVGARHDAEKLLRMNGRLQGLSKFALLPGDRAAHLCAEIPLDDQLDLRERLRETCDGFKNALRVLHQEKPILVDSKLERESDQVDLHHLCEEAGWPFADKSEGKLTIDLDTRGAFFQAWAETDTTGAVSVAVEMVRYEHARDETKEALATLLLKASGVIRMARAAIEENENQALVYFETKFASRPCVTEWHHALSSLSVACALCAQESKALHDEFVARKYMKSLKSPDFGTSAPGTKEGD